jgi:ABC-2 type transport system permease protein
MTALAVTAVSLRRLLRDRTALFFLVVLPIVIILVIGATVNNAGELRIGVVAGDPGPLATELVTDLRAAPATEVRSYAEESEARTALRRGELDAVVLLPPGLDTDLEAALRTGDTVTIPMLGAGALSTQQAARSAVEGTVARHAARVQAAAVAAGAAGGTVQSWLPQAGRLQAQVPAVTVESETVDATSDYLPTGFSYSAPTMLVLFVFITSLAGGAAMIQSRQLGIYERALAAPVRSRDIVLGETASYLIVALLQSALIVGVGAIAFDVDWGDPVAAAALVLVWALVGTGAGLLSGTLFRTPEQASAIGPAIGIAFGMLGGAMWPLEIVAPVMRTIGHLVPHAWAVDGWIEVLSRGGGIGDIITQLAVLAAFAGSLLVLATVRLRRRLTA